MHKEQDPGNLLSQVCHDAVSCPSSRAVPVLSLATPLPALLVWSWPCLVFSSRHEIRPGVLQDVLRSHFRPVPCSHLLQLRQAPLPSKSRADPSLSPLPPSRPKIRRMRVALVHRARLK